MNSLGWSDPQGIVNMELGGWENPYFDDDKNEMDKDIWTGP